MKRDVVDNEGFYLSSIFRKIEDCQIQGTGMMKGWSIASFGKCVAKNNQCCDIVFVAKAAFI